MATDIAESAELTIDELARRVGMTVRNVRAHQSRGLLPAPEIRGRTGYYGPDHVARLELIKDLQAEGFNLESIRRVLERTPGRSAAEVLDFTRAVAAPFTDEEPEIVEGAELAERFGDDVDPDLVRKV
jgi:DNA-binding transcriptional MerR regulator